MQIINGKRCSDVLSALLSLGFPKHKDRFRKTNKLTHFFQENNKVSTLAKKRNNQRGDKRLTKIKILTGHKDSLNESRVKNTSHVVRHKSSHPKYTQDEKKQRAVIQKLLCKLFNQEKQEESCKDQHHSKKAMIWPTKMLPWLKNVLINKLNRGENHFSSLDNMEDPAESLFGGESINSVTENWDGNPLLVHRKHRHGFKMVPLLKTLKAKLFGERQPNNFGSLSEALNGDGMNGFGPIPTQGSSHLMGQILRQALGNSDRNTVLNEMRQEFLLAGNHPESEGNEGFEDLTGRNNLAQLNSGLQQGSPIMTEPIQGTGLGQLGGINMLQGNLRTPLMEQPIHAQMLDNGAIAPMPRQPEGGSPLKAAPLLGGLPFGRSPVSGNPLRMSSLSGTPISLPTSRSSPLQSFFSEVPSREGSLLQRAGGFDSPISPSMMHHTSANPTQRMYTESEEELPDSTAQEDNFIERNEPEQRLSQRPKPLGNNLVMEEISDNMARGGNRPLQENPDVDRLMKLQSSFRSTESPTSTRFSRLGLRLPTSSNSIGMTSILSKDIDSINFDDLDAQRSLSFRRGKVLKRGSNSHAYPGKQSASGHDKAVTRYAIKAKQGK